MQAWESGLGNYTVLVIDVLEVFTVQKVYSRCSEGEEGQEGHTHTAPAFEGLS